ncbi:MAG: beta-lactamase family protein [Flavobacteriaceae bacterium]|nr:beta-lactamase family protein [Flavobacteriaceae bacterium]
MKKQIIVLLAVITLLLSCSSKKITQIKETTQQYIVVEEKERLNSSKLDSLFDVLTENDKFMGNIVLSLNGKIIYTNAIGFDDIESQKKSTIDTKYRIGSISKMFTASLIFKAIEEGKLNTEQTIETYFPTIENANIITIGNLLNHRSGIHNFTNDDSYLTYNTEYKTEQEMIKIISNFKSDFEPSTKGSYSNSNYVLLSFILEKIYNSTLKKLVNEKICVPLNLKNTYFGSEIDLKNNECHSYKYLAEWTKETETDMSIPLGAGAIVSTPSDLTKFIEALFTEKIISKQSLTKMTTIKDKYGMGIFQFPFNDKKSFGHTGGIDGFTSFLSFFPKENLSIALCSNGSNYDNNNIMIGALSCYFNEPFDIPIFKKIEITEADLEQYLGTYSTDKMPLKFTMTQDKNILFAQGTGQPKVALDYKGENIFLFEQVGAIFEFNPESNQFTLKQGGGEFIFTKE